MRRFVIALVVCCALALGAVFLFRQREAPAAARNVDGAAATANGLASMHAAPTSAAAVHRMAPSAARSVSAPLPPVGTPLKQETAQLQARADAGDAEAASRLYRDTQTCAGVRYVKAFTSQYANAALDRKFDGATPEALDRADKMLERMQKQLDYARDNAAFCDGVSDEDLNALFPRTLRAAQLGDPAAADCYLGTNWFDLQGVLDHPEWLTQFKQNAPALIDDGIARGDWFVVRELAQANAPLGPSRSPDLLQLVTGKDPTQYYRYLKLLSLGATPSDAKQNEFLRQRLADAADAIGADAVRDADAWAQNTYQQNFSATPQSTPATLFRECHPGMAAGYK